MGGRGSTAITRKGERISASASVTMKEARQALSAAKRKGVESDDVLDTDTYAYKQTVTVKGKKYLVRTALDIEFASEYAANGYEKFPWDKAEYIRVSKAR